ncbi:MAG: hypothetical protein ACPGU1_01625 [Myxococcota bacterium]
MPRISPSLRALGCVWLTLVLTSPAFASQDALLVGNSFILSNQPHGVAGVLSGLQEAQGGFEGAALTDVSKGGYTLTMHASDAAGSGALNTYLVTGEPSENLYRSVVLQEQSQTAGFHIADNPFGPGYQWDESLVAVEYLNSLISARGADTVFLMTWGYRDGDASIPQDLFDGYPDYMTMQAALTEGYEMYADGLSTVSRTVFVAPAGRAFQRIFEDLVAAGSDPLAAGSAFDALYSGDGRHPGLQGSYLAGCVLYATLTGRDPRRLSWAPSGIPEARRVLLQAAAAAVTVDDPYTPRPLGWGDVPRYPFVADYSDLVDAGTTDAQLGAPDMRPTALLDRIAPPVETLTLGADAGHAGRLGVFEGGRLTVGGALTVGHSGDGMLEIKGGEVSAGSLDLALEPGSVGGLELEGGLLETVSLSVGAGEGSISMTGGTLRASNLATSLTIFGGRWEVPEAGSSTASLTQMEEGVLTLTLADMPSDTARLTVSGDGNLAGTLIVSPPPASPLYSGRYVMLQATSLTTASLTLDASALGDVTVGWEVSEPTAEGQLLTVIVSGAQERPATEEPDTESEEPTDSLEPGDVAVGPEEPTDAVESGPDDGAVRGLSPQPDVDDSAGEGGASGCHGEAPGSGALWFALCVLCAAALRRRHVAIRSQASMMRLG